MPGLLQDMVDTANDLVRESRHPSTIETPRSCKTCGVVLSPDNSVCPLVSHFEESKEKKFLTAMPFPRFVFKGSHTDDQCTSCMHNTTSSSTGCQLVMCKRCCDTFSLSAVSTRPPVRCQQDFDTRRDTTPVLLLAHQPANRRRIWFVYPDTRGKVCIKSRKIYNLNNSWEKHTYVYSRDSEEFHMVSSEEGAATLRVPVASDVVEARAFIEPSPRHFKKARRN